MEAFKTIFDALRKGYKHLKDAMKTDSNARTAELHALADNADAEEKDKVAAVEAAVVAKPAVAFIDSLVFSVGDALDGLDAQVAKRAAEAKAGEKALADASETVKKFVAGNFEPREGTVYSEVEHLQCVAVPVRTGTSSRKKLKLSEFGEMQGSSTIPVVAYAEAVKAAYDANPGADPNQVHQAALSAAQKVARELIDDPVVEDMPRPVAKSTWYGLDRLDVGKRRETKASRWVAVGKKKRV